MAYVPPHKRHSKNDGRPSPSPELPPFHFIPNPRIMTSSKSADAKSKIREWFTVGFHDDELPPCVQLQPISLESVERKFGDKPLILVDTYSPWKVVADNVLQDLLSSFQNISTHMEMEAQHLHPPTALLARFGKILFLRGPSVTQDAITKNLAAGTMLAQLRRVFYRNLPTSYVDKMTNGEFLKVGLDFKEEKDLYHVKLSDANRPGQTVSCKCSVMREQNKLQLYKIELNKVTHMVTEVSCLTKNLDLRLILCTKRVLTTLEDDEMQSIQNLIESAVLDPNVKGGLRWPPGKAFSGGRFSVDEVWHTITKAYKNPSLRLNVRHVDGFDFQTSVGQSAYEVFLKLKGIVSLLQEQKIDIRLISKMLEDNFKLIWDHFLSCDHFLG